MNPISSQDILSCFSFAWKIFSLVLVWVIISCHSGFPIYVTIWERTSLSSQALSSTSSYFKSLHSILLSNIFCLFFLCLFSKSVWSQDCASCRMHLIYTDWNNKKLSVWSLDALEIIQSCNASWIEYKKSRHFFFSPRQQSLYSVVWLM